MLKHLGSPRVHLSSSPLSATGLPLFGQIVECR
jgi:hypothetical protein